MGSIFADGTVAQQSADLIIKNSQAAFHMLVQTYKRNYAAMWRNSQGVNPVAIITALGANAQQIFATASGTAAFINGLASGTVVTHVPSGWNLTYNDDGSITAIPPPAPSGSGVHPSGSG